ncbi:MAG: SUMF1/EgtB/PvdO family nonheme iron enzyme [Nitrospinae bacterium]|nr:SUMF1/EgtB/PvdO family nonheme iron enzyme [Nitrospinota bacterium]
MADFNLKELNEVLEHLHRRNKTFRCKLIEYLLSLYKEDKDLKKIKSVSVEKIVDAVYGPPPTIQKEYNAFLKKNRKKYSSLKSSLNTTFRNLFSKKKNPKRIGVTFENTFGYLPETKDEIIKKLSLKLDILTIKLKNPLKEGMKGDKNLEDLKEEEITQENLDEKIKELDERVDGEIDITSDEHGKDGHKIKIQGVGVKDLDFESKKEEEKNKEDEEGESEAFGEEDEGDNSAGDKEDEGKGEEDKGEAEKDKKGEGDKDKKGEADKDKKGEGDNDKELKRPDFENKLEEGEEGAVIKIDDKGGESVSVTETVDGRNINVASQVEVEEEVGASTEEEEKGEAAEEARKKLEYDENKEGVKLKIDAESDIAISVVESIDGTTVEVAQEVKVDEVGSKGEEEEKGFEGGHKEEQKEIHEEDHEEESEPLSEPSDDEKDLFTDGDLGQGLGAGTGKIEKPLSRLMRIEAGTFISGCNSDDVAFRPEKKVEIGKYNFGQFPVTNNYFMKFVEATNYITEAEIENKSWVFTGTVWNKVVEITEDGFEKESIVYEKGHLLEVEGANWKHPSGPLSSIEDALDKPVVHINLKEALDFLQWRSKLTGREFRLPTEYEWENAARGEQGLMYPWGNEWEEEKCNSFESKKNGLSDVDQYETESPYKIRDMMGNVWEWTLGKDRPLTNDEIALVLHSKLRKDFPVLKGGCWMTSKENLKSYYKVQYPASMRSNFIGFRCARFPVDDEL